MGFSPLEERSRGKQDKHKSEEMLSRNAPVNGLKKNRVNRVASDHEERCFFIYDTDVTVDDLENLPAGDKPDKAVEKDSDVQLIVTLKPHIDKEREVSHWLEIDRLKAHKLGDVFRE
jgi:hypothetical protein